MANESCYDFQSNYFRNVFYYYYIYLALLESILRLMQKKKSKLYLRIHFSFFF